MTKVNQKLLEKYVRNQCSEDETLIIEKWLQSNDDNPEIPSDLLNAKSSTWIRLEGKISAKKTSIKEKLTIAASILIVTICSISFYHTYRQNSSVNQLVKVKSDLHEPKYFEHNGLGYHLLKNSEVIVSNQNKKQSIKFDGYLKIQNKTSQNIKLNLETKDGNTKKIELLSHREYLIYNRYNDTNDIFVTNQSQRKTLPRQLDHMYNQYELSLNKSI